MAKIRLDVLLFERGLVESRAQALRLVMAGQVRVNGEVALKASTRVPQEAEILVSRGPQYVSRGGDKLAAALHEFPVSVVGRVCADVGASTGGFTDCLLQAGARHVYAIDVGKGILHWKLRQDERVTVMEATNARFIERLPEPIELITIDASFISLGVLLATARGWFGEQGGSLVALIKPQFEAGRAEVSRGDGVIRDPRVHHQVLTRVLQTAIDLGFQLHGLIRSPLRGPKGNVEFLAWLKWETAAQRPADPETATHAVDLEAWIARVQSAAEPPTAAE